MANGPGTRTLEQSGQRSSASRRYTYAQVCAELQETNQPCELWEGELIMSPAPSFQHQEVALRVYRHLHRWVSEHEQHGVKEYWIVDPESESVDVLHTEKGALALAMRCGPGETARSRLLPGFEIAVQEIFHGV